MNSNPNILRNIFWLLIYFLPSQIIAQQFPAPLPGSSLTKAASSTEMCGTDMLLNNLRKNVNYRKMEDKMNADIRQIIVNGAGTDPVTPYVLPVVFHIISLNPAGIGDQTIIDAVKDLNDAFAKTGNYAASAGADTKISFCLAQTDPDGGITTGITRTKSNLSTNLNPFIEDDKLKNLVQWNPSKYINIWFISSINAEISANFQCGVWSRLGEGGYATMPPGGGPSDGIVVTGFGDLLAHEMGHYLGLYHTFEGQNCANYDCSVDGDKVCDTPPDKSTANSISCNNPENSCTTDSLSNHSNGFFPTDVPDLIADFMDYGNNGCHNEFTEGQAERMRAAIATQRSGLLQNECDKPCNDNIIANFTRDNAAPVIGDVINFTNISTGGAGNFQWLLNDVVISTSTNFSYSFSSAGKFKITLKAFNTTDCYATYTDYIIVTCGVLARFYTDKRVIASKFPVYTDSIYFTNTSVNATSYQWIMSNDKGMAAQVVSTSKDMKYVFATPANYTINLVATNGGCADTTEAYYIPVADPTQDGALYIYTADCYQQTKVRITLYVCNYGYATIPKGTPVSFYDADPRLGNAHKLSPSFYLPDAIPGLCCGYLYTHIVDVQRRYVNQLYAVFNDSGTTMPLVLPNTPMAETNYANNIWNITNLAFRVTPTPTQASLQPGDTLQLTANVSTGIAASYVWKPSYNLSCSFCKTTNLFADSTSTKMVVATSQYGCSDTAYVSIKVPPYDDYTITLDKVSCAAQDSIYVNFTLYNSFRTGTIPKGLQVSFYNGDPTSASAVLLKPVYSVPNTVAAKQFTTGIFIKGNVSGKLYAVVNDSGTTKPLQLPNTPVPEKDLTNNVGQINYAHLAVSITPSQATLEPGDTLQLTAQSTPDSVSNYLWGSPHNLSCTVCQTTFLIADTNITKKVVATNQYGCTDTAYIIIKVPPANDYTIAMNDVECGANDSLYVNFTLFNGFKRGILPKGLSVSFYNANPVSGNTTLLPPVFIVPTTINAKQFTFSGFIKGIKAGNLYAVVNDTGTTFPLQLPNTVLLEKDYTNNVTVFAYQPDSVSLQPFDTTVFRKQSFPIVINTTVYDALSTMWFPSNGYTLSCSNCVSPIVTAFDSSVVYMQTANKYGCLIKGVSHINIFPPDMKVEILATKCYSNSTTQVTFKICMNNGYDSVFAKLPISFYDGKPTLGNATLLGPVFYTPTKTADSCSTYVHVIATPASNNLYAVVNDRGDNTSIIPDKIYNETNYGNDTAQITVVPFKVSISPADTSVLRFDNVLLLPQVVGGSISSYRWTPSQFISCSNCVAPTVTPPYTVRYELLVQNEYNCTDTAHAIVRTFTEGIVNIPTAFTPNSDGKNDIFYILAGHEASLIKDFSIFNRWGQKVFQVQNVWPNDPNFGWNGIYNGVVVEAGTYIYLVNMAFANGTTKAYKGTVVVIR